MDGIYTITFRGAATWGAGMLVLQNGSVTGADTAGVLYDGQYADKGSYLAITMQMTVPPGVSLVQGTPTQPKAYTFSFTASVPKNAMESGEPVLMQLPQGPVNVIFRRLRALAQ